MRGSGKFVEKEFQLRCSHLNNFESKSDGYQSLDIETKTGNGASMLAMLSITPPIQVTEPQA